jgi:hypothetical protein
MSEKLAKASPNEFKKWPILENDSRWSFHEKFDSYQDAVDALKSWIEARIQWIDENI